MKQIGIPAWGTATMTMPLIPESHRDLVDGPYWAALTTVMPDGQPQCTPVWCNREGNDNYLLTNTMRGFRKEKNMRANPHVTLLVYDPRNPSRNIEVRGLVVEMSEAGAIEHNDRLAQLYLGKPGARFLGDAVPLHLAQSYIPVKVTIAPIHVRVGEPAPSASLFASSRATSGRPDREEGTGPSAVAVILPASNPVPARVPVPVHALIPDSHRDLLVRPVHGVLSTIMPDGQPQSSVVWVDYDGTYVLINTALGRQKCRNMQANPKVTLLVVDPSNTTRWIEVRGHLSEIITDGAILHADMLAQRYLNKQHFYGGVYKAEWRQYETRVIVKIEPTKISLDAIFK